jgi:hypothetical protein
MQVSYLKCPKLCCRATVLPAEGEIVISGIAGRFPKSANVSEFADNLYNKVMVKNLQ